MVAPNILNKKLNQIFGYKAFLPGQLEIIQHIMQGGDILAVMPTGAGKSLCFQLPALLHPGHTIVVSPLVALMDDQTAALQNMGINVEVIHSGRERYRNVQAWKKFSSGESKILYLSPERLMQERMISFMKKLQIDMFVIDEAHCITKWGAGFRPDYEALSRLKDFFPDTIMAAFTATADKATRTDIADKLTRGDCKIIVRGFDRPNLFLSVSQKYEPKSNLLSYLESRKGKCGIVYCFSRKETDDIASYLNKHGFNALAYHAGKSADYRKEAQEKFMAIDGLVMVATIAFGMGIDKTNVRYVVHMSLPGSIEAFYQEIGRAGRDGCPSDTTIFYGLSDIIKRQKMIFNGEEDEKFKLFEYKRLEALIGYCETTSCRRKALLAYFDEEMDRCENCDNCLNPPTAKNYSVQASMLISAIKQTGQLFGTNHIIDVVRGSETGKVKSKRHHLLDCFGIGKNYPKSFFLSLLRQLIAFGSLRVNLAKYGAVQLTHEAEYILNGQKPFHARIVSKTLSHPSIVTKPKNYDISITDPDLFRILKKLRLEISRDKKVPAFVVFSDQSLREMATTCPQTRSEFEKINGVGEKKLNQYFVPFSDAIREYLNNHI